LYCSRVISGWPVSASQSPKLRPTWLVKPGKRLIKSCSPPQQHTGAEIEAYGVVEPAAVSWLQAVAMPVWISAEK
jgi:hypothetical protein